MNTPTRKWPSKNRYGRVYLLFKLIAQQRIKFGYSINNVYTEADSVKQYWKNFCGVDSLTDLTDDKVKNLESLLAIRLKTLSKASVEVSSVDNQSN